MDVTTNADGWILLNGKRLSQADAVKLAGDLLQATEDSIWRTQRKFNSGWYHDSKQILARSESALGRAIQATRKVF